MTAPLFVHLDDATERQLDDYARRYSRPRAAIAGRLIERAIALGVDPELLPEPPPDDEAA